MFQQSFKILLLFTYHSSLIAVVNINLLQSSPYRVPKSTAVTYRDTFKVSYPTLDHQTFARYSQ